MSRSSRAYFRARDAAIRAGEWRFQSELDEVVVERVAAGDRELRPTRAERRAVVALLHAAGLNDQEVSRRTGIWAEQVRRDRAALGLPANAPSGGSRKYSGKIPQEA